MPGLLAEGRIRRPALIAGLALGAIAGGVAWGLDMRDEMRANLAGAAMQPSYPRSPQGDPRADAEGGAEADGALYPRSAYAVRFYGKGDSMMGSSVDPYHVPYGERIRYDARTGTAQPAYLCIDCDLPTASREPKRRPAGEPAATIKPATSVIRQAEPKPADDGLRLETLPPATP